MASRFSFRAFFLVLLLLGLPLSTPLAVAAAPKQREVGGAGADQSYLARLASGLSEGIHFASMALGAGNQPGGSDNQNNRRTPKKVKLALVGFGRTGTTSIVNALQLLGYTFLHDDTLAEVSDILAQLYAKEITMDEFVQECGQRGFDGIFMFTDDFLQWAAETKDVQVLLTTRDNGRKWAESWIRVAPMIDHAESRPFVWSQTVRNIYPHFHLIYKHISTLGQPEKYKDLATLEAAYDAHLVKVRKMMPSRKLLEFNVKEGWEPLCQFLNKSIPSTPFPHVNDRVVVRTLVGTFWLITWIWPLVPLLALYLMWKLAVLLSLLFFSPSASSKGGPTVGSDKKQN